MALRPFSSHPIVMPVCVGLLLGGVPGRVLAVKPAVHSVTGFDEMAEGDAQGTGLASHGAVVLAPEVVPVAALPAGPVLAVVVDAQGTTFAAMATPGRVVAVDAKGVVKTLLEVDKPVVPALALDGKGALYAATSPEGEVLRVDLRTGKSEPFWRTEEAKHLWALAHDGTHLWVATGEPGAVFKVDAKGQATRVAEKLLQDKLFRSLAVRPGGQGVVVGGGRKGVVWAVDAKGAAYAVHDASLEEVTSLAVRADGAIAAALVANDGKAEGPDGLLGPSEAGTSADDAAPRDTKASEVVVVFPGGEARRVWRGKKDSAYAVAFVDKQGLLVGTGARGRLYHVDLTTRLITLLTQVDSNRVTAMHPTPRGILLGLSHAPALALSPPGLARQGVYLSAAQDSERTVQWGRLWGHGELPPGTKVEVRARVGNTEKPDDGWTAWSAPVPLSGGTPALPRARFAQLKVTLEGDGRVTPEVREVHLAWVAENSPPQLDAVTLLAPGVRVEPMPSDEQKGRTLTVSARAFADFEPKPLTSPAPPEPASRAKQSYETGWRTVTWHAVDEDEDDLRYTATLLGDRGTAVPLGQGLKDPFVSFDEARLPDGDYRVRVTASDESVNPPGAARTAERLSLVFSVDRTPPTLAAKVDPKAGVVRLTVEDRSAVIRITCGVDGGEAVPVAPVDGLLDSPREEATAPLPPWRSGRHWVACQAEDAAGNVGRLVLPVEMP